MHLTMSWTHNHIHRNMTSYFGSLRRLFPASRAVAIRSTRSNTIHSRWLSSVQSSSNLQEPSEVTNNHSHIKPRIDYRTLLQNIDAAELNARQRASDANPRLVATLYEQSNSLKQRANELRAERNANAKALGELKRSGGSEEEASKRQTRGQELKTEIADCETELESVTSQLESEALKLPNETHPDSPVGDEDKSRTVMTHGDLPVYTFDPKDHVDLALDLDILDLTQAAKVSGSKFVALRNEGAMLELALVHHTLSRLRSRGFQVVLPPDVAHHKMVEGCGFQPRGEATQIYSIENSDLCLAATSEISLAGMQSDEMLKTSDLPLKYAAHSHCFRTEAGHGGRLNRGLYRVHQFSKVEMFGFCADMTQSEVFFNEMLELQIELCSELGLHFKVLDMATEDLGAPAYRKYDVMAYMPGRQEYGEVASISMCTDYQSRRLHIRHREDKKESPQFAHTLNGTACAVPRLLVSLLETHQQEDGSVLVPDVLQPYLGGQDRLRKTK